MRRFSQDGEQPPRRDPDFVLNLEAAEAMGIVVPAALRLAADEVIE